MTSGAPSAAARKWLVAIVAIGAIAAASFGVTYLLSSHSTEHSSASSSASAASAKKTKRAAATTKPLWADLTPAQQNALAPLAPEWDQINAVRKKKWLELGNKIAAMPPEERQKMLERIHGWAKLTPEQRRQARANYAQTKKKLKPEEKTAQWQEYQKLPEEKKKELAAKIERAKKQVANPPQKNDQNDKITPPIKSTNKADANKTVPPVAQEPENLPAAP